MTTIVILSVNNALPSGLMGMVDIFALSGLHFVQKSGDGALSKVEWHPNVILANHDGQPITDGHGRIFEVDSDFASIKHCDAVLIPGFIPNGQGHPPKTTTDMLTRSWLATQYKKGALMCGSCSGVFALGEAGLLNNRKCTTTWWLHDELKRRFPKANAVWASELIDDNGIISAGGPLSWVTIALHIVKKLAGIETAKVVADFSVVDAIPKSQNLYVPEGYQASNNPFLGAVDLWCLFLQQFGGFLCKVVRERCSYSTQTSTNAAERAAKRCPKGSFGDVLGFVTRCSHRITMPRSSFRAQNAANSNKT